MRAWPSIFFGMAMLSMYIADAYFPALDILKVLRLTLLHELGEITQATLFLQTTYLPGETPPRTESVQRVVARLPRGAEYLALWQEYQETRRMKRGL